MTDGAEQTTQEQAQLCFHGSYVRAVDQKGRFSLPFKFRRGAATPEGERYLVVEGPDGLLLLLPFAEYQRLFNRMRHRSGADEWRAQVRRTSHRSREVEPDKQGRILVPPEYLQRAKIADKVLVVGMGNLMELWNPEACESAVESAPAANEDFTRDFYD